MNKETLAKIINAFNCASADPARYHLQCVQVTKTHIAAIDGHILSKVEHDDSALAPICDGYILIHRDQLPYLKLVLKDHRKLPMIFHVAVSSTAMLISNKLISLADAPRYPNIENLIPAQGREKKYTIALDADLLVRLANALGNPKSNIVTLEFGDANDPIRVLQRDLPHAVGVLMPARM